MLAVAPWELGQGKATEFDFNRSFVLSARTVVEVGSRKGSLAAKRLDELRQKIVASSLIAVQRLTR